MVHNGWIMYRIYGNLNLIVNVNLNVAPGTLKAQNQHSIVKFEVCNEILVNIKQLNMSLMCFCTYENVFVEHQIAEAFFNELP